MSLRSLVVLALRFQAVMGVVHGCIAVVQGGLQSWMLRSIPPSQPQLANLFWVVAVAGLAISIILWFLADPISRLICRGQPTEATLNTGGLTRRDLYAAAMVLMGVMFLGNSLQQIVGWVAYTFNPEAWRDYQSSSFERSVYALIRNMVPLIVGLLLIWKSSDWSSRLSSRDANAEAK